MPSDGASVEGGCGGAAGVGAWPGTRVAVTTTGPGDAVAIAAAEDSAVGAGVSATLPGREQPVAAVRKQEAIALRTTQTPVRERYIT